MQQTLEHTRFGPILSLNYRFSEFLDTSYFRSSRCQSCCKNFAMIRLFSLPKELWRDQVLHFITFRDIARVFEALLNHSLQNQFQTCTDGHTSSVEYVMASNHCVKKLQWCLSRNIMFSHVVVVNGLNSLPMISFGKVSNLEFYSCDDQPMGDGLLLIIQACSARLKTLHIYEHLFDLGSLSVCSKLEEFIVQNCSLHPTVSLLDSLAGCTKLTTITIAGCAHVHQVIISAVLDTFPLLEYLSFGGTESDPYHLATILAACKRTTFYVRKLVLLSHTIVTGAGLNKLSVCAPELHTLRIDCSSSCLTYEDVETFVQSKGGLTDVAFTQSQQLNDIILMTIANYLPQILHIDVTDTIGVLDIGVRVMALFCKQLKILTLSKCVAITDASVREIWIWCIQLEELNLSGCAQVTDEGFPVVDGMVDRAVLRELNVSGTSITGAPFLQSRRVRSLRCTHCKCIDSNFVRNLAGFRHVEQLFLAALQLNPTDFLVLSQHLPALRAVHLTASSVSDEILRSLAEHCPSLRSVLVVSCAAVTAQTVNQLNLLYKGKLKILYRP